MKIYTVDPKMHFKAQIDANHTFTVIPDMGRETKNCSF
jgi:hypothetical protein